jgi:hypothetical protein
MTTSADEDDGLSGTATNAVLSPDSASASAPSPSSLSDSHIIFFLFIFVIALLPAAPAGWPSSDDATDDEVSNFCSLRTMALSTYPSATKSEKYVIKE